MGISTNKVDCQKCNLIQFYQYLLKYSNDIQYIEYIHPIQPAIKCIILVIERWRQPVISNTTFTSSNLQCKYK